MSINLSHVVTWSSEAHCMMLMKIKQERHKDRKLLDKELVSLVREAQYEMLNMTQADVDALDKEYRDTFYREKR